MPFEFLGDMFRSFFGFKPPERDGNDYRIDVRTPEEWNDDHRRHNFQNRSNDSGDIFDMFNESLEMHRHFEEQFGDMMKIFSHSFPHMGFPESAIQYGGDDDRPSRSIRDEYLKPGFQSDDGRVGKDSDVDGLIQPNDLTDFIKTDDKKSLVPRSQNPDVSMFDNRNPITFGRVIITRTITKPDGTVETQRTVRDTRTNEEETTVTVTKNDDRYSDSNIFPDSSSKNIWDKFFAPK